MAPGNDPSLEVLQLLCRQAEMGGTSGKSWAHNGPCSNCLMGSNCDGSCLLTSSCLSSSTEGGDGSERLPQRLSQSSWTSLGSLSLLPVTQKTAGLHTGWHQPD